MRSPPNGCLQYHTGLTGRFSTFNFMAGLDQNHLNNHECVQEANWSKWE